MKKLLAVLAVLSLFVVAAANDADTSNIHNTIAKDMEVGTDTLARYIPDTPRHDNIKGDIKGDVKTLADMATGNSGVVDNRVQGTGRHNSTERFAGYLDNLKSGPAKTLAGNGCKTGQGKDSMGKQPNGRITKLAV